MKIKQRLGNLLKTWKLHLIIACITEELVSIVSYGCCSLRPLGNPAVNPSRHIRYKIFITGIYSHHRGTKNAVVGHLRDSRGTSIEREVNGNN